MRPSGLKDTTGACVDDGSDTAGLGVKSILNSGHGSRFAGDRFAYGLGCTSGQGATVRSSVLPPKWPRWAFDLLSSKTLLNFIANAIEGVAGGDRKGVGFTLRGKYIDRNKNLTIVWTPFLPILTAVRAPPRRVNPLFLELSG